MSRLRHPSPRAIALIAVAIAAICTLAVILVTMGHSDFRRTGTNSLVVPTHAVLPAGGQVCQANQYVAAGSGFVAPWIGGANGAPGATVDVSVTAAGRQLASGRSPASYPTGITRMPLDRTIDRDVNGATVCFTNHGKQTLFVYADYAPAGSQAAQAPSTENGAPVILRLDWYAHQRESWWSQLSRIADRFPLVKAGFLGPWAFWLALVLAIVLPVAAVARVLREAQSP